MSATVRDVMHPGIVSCAVDTGATEAMVRHGAHHVVVAEPDRHTPVGILSTLDVATAPGREEDET